MNTLIEFFKIIIPTILALLVAYLIINKILDNEKKRLEAELKKTNAQIVTPIKIQAYERFVLLLERIHPNHLVLRMHHAKMTNNDLQKALVQSVKSEFEHNLSQQIYVSNKAWELIKNAKEEIIQIINITSLKVLPNDNSGELAKLILNVVGNLNKKLPNEVAIEFLKLEFTQNT